MNIKISILDGDTADPISGATVCIGSTMPAWFIAVTGDDGRVAFRGMPPIEIRPMVRIAVTKPGYKKLVIDDIAIYTLDHYVKDLFLEVVVTCPYCGRVKWDRSKETCGEGCGND